MVNCCVNPACPAEHKLLRTGDVYAIETLHAGTKYVWICSTCAGDFEVCLDPTGSALVRRRSDPVQPPQASPQVSLRLVEHGARGVPLQHTAPASTFPGKDHSGDRGEHAHGAHI
jgi:hypothetical protein